MKKIVLLSLCLLGGTAISQTTVTTITPEIEGSGGLCMDADGNVYIADFGDSLGGPDQDGLPNNILQLDTDNNLSIYATDFIGASGNNFDNNGVLHQSDIWAGGIYKIVNGERVLVTNDGIVAPVGVVFDSEDNFYVCNCGNGTIQKVTPSGDSSVFSSGAEFACPNGMTIDEDDNLYVVNFSNSNIVKIDPSGTPSIIGNTNAGNGHIDYDINTGNLYIASFGGQQLFYINKDDLELEVLGGTAGVRGNNDGPIGTATFSNPNGIVVSATGDSIYVNSAAQLTGSALNPQVIRLITGVRALSVAENDVFDYDVKTYPNPAGNIFTIESRLPLGTHDDMLIQVHDITGKLLLEQSNLETANGNLKETIDISSLQSGHYFYTLSSKGAQLYNGKLIKK